MTTFITTESGREYKFTKTQTQGMVCIWEDETGNPYIKGSFCKVWEDCTVRTSKGQFVVGARVYITGTDRYTMRPVSRHTTRIVKVRSDNPKVADQG